MGIGNLNNNFGKLTANHVMNKTAAKNSAKAEAFDLKPQVKSDSLNSATLNDKQGQLFDSNNIELGNNIADNKTNKGGGNKGTGKTGGKGNGTSGTGGGKGTSGSSNSSGTGKGQQAKPIAQIILNIASGIFSMFGLPGFGDVIFSKPDPHPQQWDDNYYNA